MSVKKKWRRWWELIIGAWLAACVGKSKSAGSSLLTPVQTTLLLLLLLLLFFFQYDVLPWPGLESQSLLDLAYSPMSRRLCCCCCFCLCISAWVRKSKCARASLLTPVYIKSTKQGKWHLNKNVAKVLQSCLQSHLVTRWGIIIVLAKSIKIISSTTSSERTEKVWKNEIFWTIRKALSIMLSNVCLPLKTQSQALEGRIACSM